MFLRKDYEDIMKQGNIILKTNQKNTKKIKNKKKRKHSNLSKRMTLNDGDDRTADLPCFK